jgi:hypothetical protein
VICTELAKASRSGYSSRDCSAAKKLLSIPAGGTVVTATTQITNDTQGHCSRSPFSMPSLWGIHATDKEC